MSGQRLWIAAGLLAALLFWKRNTVASMTIATADALNNPNVQAFLAMIRAFESAGRYDVLYGGATFNDYSAHPDVKVPFNNPLRAPHADGTPNDFSTAAGAYQINWPTWQLVYPLIDGNDFSPASQDEAAVQLLKTNGALTQIMAGNFSGALLSASGTWASLPGSTSGQHQVSALTAQNTYLHSGGAIA